MIVYKLFRVRKNGTLAPLFINASQVVPIGQWLPAVDKPTKGFAHRPGWHAGTLPMAAHLTEKGRVWCQCTVAGDQLTPTANPELFRKTGDMGQVPNGWYTWKRPVHQGGSWIIAGSIKVDKVLTDAEVKRIRETA